MNIFGFFWQDIIEILFFAFMIDVISHWLATDTYTHLLFYFYSFWALLSLSFFFQLSSMSTFLLIGAPVIAVLFILFHQRCLQKNFVTFTRSSPLLNVDNDIHWIDIAIQGCLKALNHQKAAYILIEKSEACDLLLEEKVLVNTRLSAELFELILTHPLHDSKKCTVLNTKGTLLYMNATIPLLEEEQEKKHHLLDQIGMALFLSTNTDIIFMLTHPEQRTFELIHAGIRMTSLSAEQTRLALKLWVSGKKNNLIQGAFHATDDKASHCTSPFS